MFEFFHQVEWVAGTAIKLPRVWDQVSGCACSCSLRRKLNSVQSTSKGRPPASTRYFEGNGASKMKFLRVSRRI
jgi:hypothetical protein